MEITFFKKPIYKTGAFLFACCILLLSSCIKDKCETTRTYVRYNPVIRNLSEIRDFKVMPAQALQAYGKIWKYGDYLLINEPKKGIHIFDNSNPSNPQALSFINIPGNVDMAVQNNTLYADNYIDLLVIDINDPQNPTLQKRIENQFNFYSPNNNNDVIVDYEPETVTEVYKDEDCNAPGGGGFFWGVREEAVMDNSSGGNIPGSGGTTSIGGSTARFTLHDNYLYIIADQSNLVTYDISAAQNPVKKGETRMSWGMETVFPYKDMLFVGANAGMFIYDLSNAANPTFISQFSHANACDPVVVKDDIAYITLRDGTKCNSYSNQLDVVDVKNIYSPRLIKSYPMHNPHGLGIDENTLFICDGDDGLKVYDATDVTKIDENQIGHYKDLDTYDVIPYGNVLILTSKNGIFQYDYSDPKNLKLLSKISI
jgi:hypothetical protein